jgi:hypothetical protein
MRRTRQHDSGRRDCRSVMHLANEARVGRRSRVAVERRRSRHGEEHKRGQYRERAAPSESAGMFHRDPAFREGRRLQASTAPETILLIAASGVTVL